MTNKAANAWPLATALVAGDALLVNSGDTGATPGVGNPRRVAASVLAAFLATATLAAGSITTSQPMTLTQTWNAAGVTFTGFKVNITNTASAAASLLADWQVGGTSVFKLGPSLATFAQTVAFNAATALTVNQQVTINGVNSEGVALVGAGSGNSVHLFIDANNTLALRNGTAAQIFNLYATYTDASNYARLTLSYDGSEYKIGGQHAGTGTPQSLYLLSDKDILFGVISSGVSWKIDTSSNFLCGSDGGGNIGASGANRPTQLFLAPSTTAHANINLPATGVAPTSPNNGDLWFDGTGLKMQIGGVTKTATFT